MPRGRTADALHGAAGSDTLARPQPPREPILSSSPITNELLHVLFLVAIAAEAMTAALAAGRREMDWLGVCLLGCITALGGGSVRDLLLDHHPLSWIAHPSYLLLTGGAALVTIALARFIHPLRHGLGLPWSIAIVSGMITGCVGGVLRDVLCNEVPLLFRAELYATVSIVAGALYVAGLALELHQETVTSGALAIGLALRLLALRFGWSMPKFVYTRDLH